MSRIDELISELAPQGAPYRRVGDVFEAVATPRGIKRSDYSLGKAIPIVDQGQSLIAGYTDNGSLKIDEGPYVVFGDHTRAVKWIDFPFAVGADGTKVLKAKSGVLPKFAYYTMTNLDITDRGYNRHWTIVRDLRIPLPPLEVQREIVRVLDKFTQLEAELEAELEARRQQYAYYRTALLVHNASADVEWSTLGKISTRVSSGATPKAGAAAYYDGGTIPWLRTAEVTFGEIRDTETRITDLALKETGASWIRENCVIVAISGATAGRSAINKIPLTTNQHCCNLQIDESRADYRYVFYWVSAKYKELKALGRGARSDLNAQIVKDFPIPLPSLDTQRQIVDVLDKFDALANDLSIGLPAELAARRQQYEYYRDKLLTFEEAAS